MSEPGLEAVGATHGMPDAAHIYASNQGGRTTASEDVRGLDEIALARANEYRLLSALLARPPSQDLLVQLARIKGDATKLGAAHAALAEAAAATDSQAATREYFDLFVGVGRGELLPYASYYLTGFLQERPLAQVRDDMVAIGIERAESSCEPEDHIGTLCEIMAGLAAGEFEADAATEQRFFERNLKPWAARFFADLEKAEAAHFYRNVGRLGRLFMDIEAEGFAMLA